MAQSPLPVPVPRPRLRRAVKNLHRQKLVDLFEGFSAGTVSDEQIQTARECIHHGGSPSSRYIQIPFEDILSRNEVGGLIGGCVWGWVCGSHCVCVINVYWSCEATQRTSVWITFSITTESGVLDCWM